MTFLFVAVAFAYAYAGPVRVMSLTAGSSTVIRMPGISRVAVGDAKIAAVVPIGTTQIVVNGKAAGRTTVVVWAAGERVTYDVTVTDQYIDDLAVMVTAAIGEPGVHASNFNHRHIVVDGIVDDIIHYQRVASVVAHFAPLLLIENYSIVNVVRIQFPFGQVEKALASIPKSHDLRMDADPKGNVIVSGSVEDRTTAELVLDRARGLAGPFLAEGSKVVDRLAVTSVSQINVKVYILEVDSTALSQLGIRLQGANPDPNLPNTLIYGDPTFLSAESGAQALAGKALSIAPFFRATRLAPTLDAILRNGHARVLSEPNLVTTPGQLATFLVGGEVPYAYSTGLGQVSIVFKEYGVKLQITPTLLGNGGIETKIAPEVSQLDFQDGIQLNGYTVPALKTSRLSTDLITKPGESIVMGGLIQRIEQRNIDKVPLLGDLPILGKLFRSTRYQHSQTDVVFIMTPDIITQ